MEKQINQEHVSVQSTSPTFRMALVNVLVLELLVVLF